MPKPATLSVLAGAAGVAALGAVWHRSLRRRRHKRGDSDQQGDDNWLGLAAAVRLTVEPPCQSKFRVVAIVTFTDGRGTGRHVVGVNMEGHTLANSLCAEVRRTVIRTIRVFERMNVSRQEPRPPTHCSARMCRRRRSRARRVRAVPDDGRRRRTGVDRRGLHLDRRGRDVRPGAPLPRAHALAPRRVARDARRRRPGAVRRRGRRVGVGGVASARPDADGDDAGRAACANRANGEEEEGDGGDGAVVHAACQRKALKYGCTLDPIGQLAPAIEVGRSHAP